MSHAGKDDNEGADKVAEHSRRWNDLQQMIAQGRSFSGNERNCCFLNASTERFATISAVSGLDFPDDGRAIAVVDWDNDGDLDLWVSNRNAPRLRFFRNNNPAGNHFVSLRLQGNGTTTNRDAIGARVEVVAAGLGQNRLIRTVRAGEGFLAQSSKWAHFGLGALESIDKVKVAWPGGDVEEFTGIKADGRYLLVQGKARAEHVPASREKVVLEAEAQETPTSEVAVRIPFVTQFPMPKQETYQDFAGIAHPLHQEGRPTLLLFWASWCAPCHAELRDLIAQQEAIRAAGINVVALAVDGLAEDGSEPEAARKLVESLKFPFAAGQASAEQVQMMTDYHFVQVTIKRPLPIPTSYLIDAGGRISVMYVGRVNVADVRRDAARSVPPRERLAWAACLPGRVIHHDGLWKSYRLDKAHKHNIIARTFAVLGRPQDAAENYHEALIAHPDFGEAHQGLAIALDELGQHSQAVHHYRQALKKHPKRPFLHFKLGNALDRLGKFEQSITCYRTAVELSPRSWDAHFKLAVALQQMKRPQEAAVHYRRTLALKPDFLPARLALDQLWR